MDREIWKDITILERQFLISNNGKIINKAKNKFVNIFKTKCGYSMISITIKHKNYNFYVHRLVAQAFIPNQNNLPQVNHINGIKSDNRVENLEWCNCKYNIKHSYKIGLANGERKAKPIIQMKDNVVIAQYNSVNQASKSLGINKCLIYGVLNSPQKHKTSHGFEFRYIEKGI